MAKTLAAVEDDSTNLTFKVEWSPTPGVKDNAHDLEHDFFKSTGTPSFVGAARTTNPATVTSTTVVIQTTHADGVTAQRHRATGRLLSTGGAVVDELSNSGSDISPPS